MCDFRFLEMEWRMIAGYLNLKILRLFDFVTVFVSVLDSMIMSLTNASEKSLPCGKELVTVAPKERNSTISLRCYFY